MDVTSTRTFMASGPRRVAAILISALLPGAGQLLLGRTRWALAFALLPVLSMALVPTFGLAAAIAVLAWRLVASVHAVFCKTRGSEAPSAGKTALQAVLLLLLTLALTTGIKRDVVENVTMVDGSMMPALETGDYVVVDKTAYGWRLPFTSRRAGASTPQIGDLVAYDNPDAPDQLMVGRLLGRPPLSYAMAGGELLLDDLPLEQQKVGGDCSYREVDLTTREWVSRRCVRRQETLGARHWGVLLDPDAARRPSSPRRSLAAGTVLVARDNRRDASAVRAIRADTIRGRVKMVWLSTAGPGGIRWDRTGLKVK
jgi:signal peptidase I